MPNLFFFTYQFAAFLSSILGEGTPFGCSGYLASAGPLNPGTPQRGSFPNMNFFNFRNLTKWKVPI
jgi:hypothetical protein